jgi:hypothetical protein
MREARAWRRARSYIKDVGAKAAGIACACQKKGLTQSHRAAEKKEKVYSPQRTRRTRSDHEETICCAPCAQMKKARKNVSLRAFVFFVVNLLCGSV